MRTKSLSCEDCASSKKATIWLPNGAIWLQLLKCWLKYSLVVGCCSFRWLPHSLVLGPLFKATTLTPLSLGGPALISPASAEAQLSSVKISNVNSFRFGVGLERFSISDLNLVARQDSHALNFWVFELDGWNSLPTGEMPLFCCVKRKLEMQNIGS